MLGDDLDGRRGRLRLNRSWKNDADHGQNELKDERAEYANTNRSHDFFVNFRFDMFFSRCVQLNRNPDFCLAALAGLLGGFHFLKTELLFEFIVRLTVTSTYG